MKIKNIIKDSVDFINLQLKKNNKINFKKNCFILGPKSNLDSLIIVNLFLEIENKIKKNLKKKINLMEFDFFDKKINSNYTIQDLEKDINKKLITKK